MKTDKEINEIIKQGLEEYAKAETKSEDTANVTFSKEHEEKMQKMFNNMRKENKSNKPADRELVIHIKFNWLTKVAVAVIVVGVFVSAVSTGIKAWKASRLNSYEGKNNEYSWLLPNNTSEMYDKRINEENVKYVKSIFPILSGDITNVEITNTDRVYRIMFSYNGEKITMKIRNNMSVGMNEESESVQTIMLENTEVYYCEYDEGASFKWDADNVNFDIYGNISLEEGKSMIETIQYEKIETNF